MIGSKFRSQGVAMPTRKGITKAVASIPQEQWNLPVGYSPDGIKFVSLREAVREKTPHLGLPSLSDEQRANLVAARIEAQPEFEVAMIGAGIVDKNRAINEVKARSSVGRTLMDIEQRVIHDVLQQAEGLGN
jgi:hypothetical protein